MGREVRLRCAYFVKATRFETDPEGNVTKVYATYDPATAGGNAPDGRKVKATIHWVSAEHAKTVEARLYDRLFRVEAPDVAPEGGTFLDNLNPGSLKVLENVKVEPSLAELRPGDKVQFERVGYFCVDTRFSRPGAPVFNRTVTLKDEWAKIQAKG